MDCPACGARNPDDKEFCGDCGTHLPGAAIPAQPTPPQQYAPVPPTPPKKKRTGTIIAIVAAIILLCAFSCCMLLFVLPGDSDPDGGDIVVEAEDGRGRIEIKEEQGFESSMKALEDVADQYYRGDEWWYLVIGEEDDYEEYYITPDEATYDKGVILEKRNEQWFVSDVYTVDMSQVAIEEGEDEPATDTADLSDEEAAAWTVNELLLAILDGRMDDAYDLTTTPLYDYDLSELTGQYDDWEFIGAEIQNDGSVMVIVTLHWVDDTQENVAALVVAENGTWYVSDLGSADE